jgi:hypothetical protein
MYSSALAIRSSGRLCGLGTKGATRQRSSFSAILTLHRAKVEIHFSRISVDAARPARPFHRSDITARETKYSAAEAGWQEYSAIRKTLELTLRLS